VDKKVSGKVRKLTDKRKLVADKLVPYLLNGETKQAGIKKVAESMCLSESYVGNIAFLPIVREYIDARMGKTPPPDPKIEVVEVYKTEDLMSIGWINREFRKIYDKMADDDAKERADKINILDKISRIYEKYNGKIEDEANQIKVMSMEELQRKFIAVTNKLSKQENTAKMLCDLMGFKYEPKSV
jgi:hypothetical protein